MRGGGMDQVPWLWQQQQIYSDAAPGIVLCPVSQSGGALVEGEVNWTEVLSLAAACHEPVELSQALIMLTCFIAHLPARVRM